MNSNYTIILYKASEEPYGEIYSAINTNYMTITSITQYEIDSMIQSGKAVKAEHYVPDSKYKKIILVNYNRKGTVVDLRNKLVILFKFQDGAYLVADNNCILRRMTLQEIKSNRDKFSGIQFVGNGITTKFGKIPTINKRAYLIYKMESYNYKLAMTGKSTLSYDFDLYNELVVTGYRNSKDINSQLVIPDFVKYIADKSFCDTHIKSIYIGNSVEKIGKTAFANCKGLSYVRLGDNVTEIGDFAFAYCSECDLTVDFNDKLSIIGTGAFLTSHIHKISISGDLRLIGSQAFKFTPLEIIDIYDTKIEKLHDGIFMNTYPVDVKFPKNLKSLSVTNFMRLERLQSLYISTELETSYVTAISVDSIRDIKIRECISELKKQRKLGQIDCESLREKLKTK